MAFANINGLQFGASGITGVDTVGLSINTNAVELNDGTELHELMRSVQASLNPNITLLDYWGIYGGDTDFTDAAKNNLGRTLESVTLSIQEDIVQHDTGTGNPPSVVTPTPLTEPDALIVFRTRYTMTVNGFGTLPDGTLGAVNCQTSQCGKEITVCIQPAIDALAGVKLGLPELYADAGDGFKGYLHNPSRDANNTDWGKFSFELRKSSSVFNANGVHDTSLLTCNGASELATHIENLLQTNTLGLAAGTNGYYTFTKTINISADNFWTVEYSIDLFPKALYQLDNTLDLVTVSP